MKYSQESFIKKCKEKYGDKYSYEKTVYKGSTSKVIITCPKHGDFEIRASNFLLGHECKKCGMEKKPQCQPMTKKEFIEKAMKIHGDKYDYSKIEYKNNYTPITIICPKHGKFQQTPYMHLRGVGCSECTKERQHDMFAKTTEQFIADAKKVHGDKFDYSKVKYVNNKTHVTIICKKHGEFQQTPSEHLRGFGCPICNSSHLETEVRDLLIKNHIEFEEQKKFDWLGRQSLDFYIPSKNIGIECQGKQHFKPMKFFGGIDGYEAQKERDTRKIKLCKDNHLKLLYYANSKYGDDEVITDKSKLLKLVK